MQSATGDTNGMLVVGGAVFQSSAQLVEFAQCDLSSQTADYDLKSLRRTHKSGRILVDDFIRYDLLTINYEIVARANLFSEKV